MAQIAGQFISLARVVKTQGRRGEVGVEVHTDVPDRFVTGMRVFALADDGERRELKIDELWPHKSLLILKFSGVDDMNDAESIVGCELQVPEEERAQLEPGWTYISDLVGCVVLASEREIGTVQDLRFGAGEAPLLVVQGDKEYEIPFAQAFLKAVDPEHKRILMELPDGLLELSAPLTDEEKEQQKNRG